VIHPKKTAHTTGLLYLIIIICAGFSEGYVRGNLIVPGDASATASNIIASEGLFRIGFALDLIAFVCDLAVSILLYELLKPVNKTLSLIAAALRLLAHPAIASINLLNHLVAIQLLGGVDYLNVFEQEQLNALVLTFLNMHTTGYLIAGVFFGVHCLLLGYLLFFSVSFPRVLGIFMAVAAVGYLVNSFGNFLMPQYKALFDAIVVGPAVIAELSLCLWLLIKGVKE
jgi:hypothetical protein